MAPDPAPTAETAAETALYAGPVEAFVERRTALARELRQRKDKVGAARVGRLRRPTLGAWALDQVAHGEPERIERLLAVGDHLRDALDAAVRGDAHALRTAEAEQRTAVDDVVWAAMAALADGGHAGGDTVQRRIADTLHAALVDDSVADDLRAGRLVSEHEAPGFGMGLDLAAAAAAAAPARPRPAESTAKAAPAAKGEPAATAKVSERQRRAHEEREAKARKEEAARAERERIARGAAGGPGAPRPRGGRPRRGGRPAGPARRGIGGRRRRSGGRRATPGSPPARPATRRCGPGGPPTPPPARAGPLTPRRTSACR